MLLRILIIINRVSKSDLQPEAISSSKYSILNTIAIKIFSIALIVFILGMTGLTTKDRFRTGAYTTDWATKDTTKAGAFTTDWTTKDRTKAGAFKTKDKTKAFSRY